MNKQPMTKQQKKKLLISATALITAAALGAGGWYGLRHRGKDPVFVYEFMNVGMTEFWGDNQESYGPVSSDNIQTVFLSDTQEITKILVQEGDEVKKGDLLMTFDTTLSAIDLERKRLEVEKLKLQLKDEEAALMDINNMKPMQSPPSMPEMPEPDLGPVLPGQYLIRGQKGTHDGSAPEKPLILWLDSEAFLTDAVIREALQKAGELQVPDPTEDTTAPTEASSKASAFLTDTMPQEEPLQTEEAAGTAPQENTSPETEPPVETAPKNSYEGRPQGEGKPGWILRATPIWDLPGQNARVIDLETREELTLAPDTKVLIFRETEPGEYDEVWVQIIYQDLDTPAEENPSYGWVPLKVVTDKDPAVGGEADAPTEETEATETESAENQNTNQDNTNATEQTENIEPQGGNGEEHQGGNTQTQDTSPTTPPDPDPTNPSETQPETKPQLPTTAPNKCYVVLRITEENRAFGSTTVWQGLQFREDGSFRFFDAAGIEDLILKDQEAVEENPFFDFDFGSGLTWAQINELRIEQKKKIKDVELKIRMAEADYKIKKREMDDGNIHAEFDGVVVSLLAEDDARARKKPMIKVSGGGGFYVEGSVNELDREKMEIGQEVTVNDWNTGESYSGKVVSVGDFPVGSGRGGGMGNPNSTLYPFKVFVEGSANLQSGSFVSMQYSAGGSEHGIYLENPFLRRENGMSYVYVMGDNGRLEKRPVITGKSLWGSYTEIRSGLSQEDLVAFPYGKNVKPGAKAKLGDMSDLYG